MSRRPDPSRLDLRDATGRRVVLRRPQPEDVAEYGDGAAAVLEVLDGALLAVTSLSAEELEEMDRWISQHSRRTGP